MPGRSPGPPLPARRSLLTTLAGVIAALLVAGVGRLASHSGEERPPSAVVHAEASAHLEDDDQARARRIVLQEGDFPPGWARWHDDAAGPPAGGTRAGACPDVVEPASGRLRGEARSAFSRDGMPFAFVTSWAGVLEDEKLARAGFDALRADAFLACALRQFVDGAAQHPAGAFTFVAAPAQALELPALGEQVGGTRFPFAVRGPGVETSAFLDVVAVRVERTVALATFASAAGPLDPALERALLAHLSERMSP